VTIKNGYVRLRNANGSGRRLSAGKLLAFLPARSRVRWLWDWRFPMLFVKPMSRCVHYCRCPSAILILLSFASLQGASRSRAFASCGDWLAHPAQVTSAVDNDASQMQVPAHEGPSANVASDSSQRPRPTSCQGPSCRSGPSMPIPSAPPSTSNPIDKLMFVGRAALHDADLRGAFIDGNPVAHAFRGFPASIEHPPRA
jgi:hypothetical protein